MTLSEMWDYILENGIATEGELSLVVTIAGYNEETLNSILYAKTGYNTIEQLEEEN